MAHFLTLVFGEDVDRQLLPYNMKLTVAAYRVFLEKFQIEDMCSVAMRGQPLKTHKDVIEFAKNRYGLSLTWSAKHKKYFYWSKANKRGKWMSTQVGGHWANYLPIKPDFPGSPTHAKIRSIDWEMIKKHDELPFAFVINGRWFEKGEMLEIGAALDEMPKKKWAEIFWKEFEKLTARTDVTVIDCML